MRSNKEAHALFSRFMKNAKEVYSKLQELSIQNEDARFVLPNAAESRIVVIAHFREWRLIIELRGNPEAQWEIRKISIEVLRLLKDRVPIVFGDFNINDNSETIWKL